MDIVLIVLAVLLALTGIAGALVPGLPGPPLAFAALLLLHFSSTAEYSVALLAGFAAAAIVITVLDYVVPSMSTKRFGGSKAGIWGCNIGIVISLIGLPFGPQGLLGIIVWPFVGALVGELLGGKETRPAFRAAFGAFIGFVTGTGLKLVYGIVAAFLVARDLIN